MPDEDKANPAIDSSADILSAVNHLQAFKSKLIDGSDSQFGLVKILEMLNKNYKNVIDKITKFMHLSFDTQDRIIQAKDFLLEGSMGVILADLQGTRSRCEVIKDIYYEFLQIWFSDKLGDKSAEIDNVFRDRLTHDVAFVKEINDIGLSLKKVCREIYPLVLNEDFTQASMKISQFSNNVNPSLNRLADEWEKLSSLEADLREKLR